MLISWKCPDCGMTEEITVRATAWPEAISQYRTLVRVQHSLRRCLYVRALGAAA